MSGDLMLIGAEDQNPPLNQEEAIQAWVEIHRDMHGMSAEEVMREFTFTPDNDGGSYLMARPRAYGQGLIPGQWSQLCKRWTCNGHVIRKWAR